MTGTVSVLKDVICVEDSSSRVDSVTHVVKGCGGDCHECPNVLTGIEVAVKVCSCYEPISVSC